MEKGAPTRNTSASSQHTLKISQRFENMISRLTVSRKDRTSGQQRDGLRTEPQEIILVPRGALERRLDGVSTCVKAKQIDPIDHRYKHNAQAHVAVSRQILLLDSDEVGEHPSREQGLT